MSEWISANKRLPVANDNGADLLVFCDGEIGMAWYGWEYDERFGLDRYGADDFDGIPPHWHWCGGNLHVPPLDVTHWMPLPEPPTKIS